MFTGEFYAIKIVTELLQPLFIVLHAYTLGSDGSCRLIQSLKSRAKG